jgi:hypothetical protein
VTRVRDIDEAREYYLSEACDESKLAWAGYPLGDFRPFADAPTDGLAMPLPYRAGRIPVVFVHGTLSIPARDPGRASAGRPRRRPLDHRRPR